MKLYAENGSYRVFLLEPETDGQEGLEFFARVQNAFYADRCVHPDLDVKDPAKILKVAQEEGSAYWEDVYCEARFAHFVLFKEDQPIGQATTAKDSENSAVEWMMGSYILFDHRGKGLSRHLYEARLLYLAENPDIERVHLWTRPENRASQRAAEHNGFWHCGQHVCNPEDGPMELYKRRLDDYRRQLQTIPDVSVNRNSLDHAALA